jgi:nitrate reductase cytochrome c-type subunit
MPYSVTNSHPDCSGYAVVKDSTNEVMGCHKTKSQAEAQLTALNIAEYGDGKRRTAKALQILKLLRKIG